MKRTGLMMLMLVQALMLFGQQNGNFSRITVKDSIWLSGKWVKAFTEVLTDSDSQIPTTRAVKKYIDTISFKAEHIVSPKWLNHTLDGAVQSTAPNPDSKEGHAIKLGGDTLIHIASTSTEHNHSAMDGKISKRFQLRWRYHLDQLVYGER